MNWPVWGGFGHPPLCCFGFWRGGGGEEGGELGGGRSIKDETVLGGWFGQVWGLSGPRRRRGRALALSLFLLLLAYGLWSRWIRAAVFFFPPLFSLANCLPCSLAPASPFFLPSPFPRLSFLPFSGPSWSLREARREAALSLAPLAPFHRPRSSRFPTSEPRFWRRNASELLVVIYLFFSLHKPRWSVPFWAAIFLTRSERFGVPFPCVLGEV